MSEPVPPFTLRASSADGAARMRSAARTGTGRALKAILCAALFLLAIGAGLVGYWGYLAYFGGERFVAIPATGRPVPGRADMAAVIVSGDMGFSIGMGPRVARRLSADGIPVLGVNSLVYFRQRRTPEEIRVLITDAVRRGLAQGHARRLILIGQSFGADMVHVGLTGLPPALRRRIAMVALVVPTNTVDYQASPAELLDLARPDADALTTARRLNWVPVLCVHGREETDSLCPRLDAANVHRVALPGGHPLRRDVDALYMALTTGMDAYARRF